MQSLEQLKSELESLDENEKIQYLENFRKSINTLSPLGKQPINLVQWVDIDKVQANDYNPNSVAGEEMNLLYVSILHDGYTQPVVTIYDKDIDKYIIIDGFHRYFTCKNKS